MWTQLQFQGFSYWNSPFFSGDFWLGGVGVWVHIPQFQCIHFVPAMLVYQKEVFVHSLTGVWNDNKSKLGNLLQCFTQKEVILRELSSSESTSCRWGASRLLAFDLWWIGEVSHKKDTETSNFGSITYERSTVEPGQDYVTSVKLGPNVVQNMVGNLSFLWGLNGIFSRASHRIPSRCCSRHLQFFEIFGPAKARRSAHSRAILSDTHSCTCGLRDHVGLRKSWCILFICPSWRCSRLKTLKVLLAIWLCRHVIWACHKKHSPYSRRYGRVNSENSCTWRSCTRCCGPWFHSRRLIDFVKSLSQGVVTVCPILLKRKLQRSTLMRI